jgi:c-di-GMP-related signal transduction protein
MDQDNLRIIRELAISNQAVENLKQELTTLRSMLREIVLALQNGDYEGIEAILAIIEEIYVIRL